MTFKVGTAPHSQWEALIPLLENLGWRNPQGDDLETWYQDAGVSSDGTHMLLYTRPDAAVAQAIDAGQAPSDALQAWRIAVQHMLVFYRRNRGTSVILDVRRVLRNPGACVVALKQHMGLKAKSSSIALDQPKPVATRNEQRATWFVSQHEELADVISELDACTLPIDDPAYHSPRLYVLELYRELQTDAPKNAERRMEECERLLKALTRLEHDLEDERRRHSQTKKALNDAREDSDLVLHQLLEAHKELERRYSGGKNSESGRGQARKGNAQNNVASTPLAPVRRGVVRKLVGPIRFVLKPLSIVKRVALRKDIALLRQSELFDAEWYLQKYPDVAHNKLDPAEHYLRYGAKELRDPSSRFSTNRYLQTYADVAKSGMNPLVHYLSFGKSEGRLAAP